MKEKGEDIAEIKAEVLNALAHPLRLKILEKLRQGPCCVCRIIPCVGGEQSNVSHHLAILRNAGVVTTEKRGMQVWYEVNNAGLFEIIDALNQYLARSLKRQREVLLSMARQH